MNEKKEAIPPTLKEILNDCDSVINDEWGNKPLLIAFAKQTVEFAATHLQAQAEEIERLKKENHAQYLIMINYYMQLTRKRINPIRFKEALKNMETFSVSSFPEIERQIQEAGRLHNRYAALVASVERAAEYHDSIFMKQALERLDK